MNCWLSVLLQSSLSPPGFRELLVIPRYISPLPIPSQKRRSRPPTILPRLAALRTYCDRTFTPSLFGAFVRLQYNPREVRCFNHDSQAIPRIKGANSSAKPLDFYQLLESHFVFQCYPPQLRTSLLRIFLGYVAEWHRLFSLIGAQVKLWAQYHFAYPGSHIFSSASTAH